MTLQKAHARLTEIAKAPFIRSVAVLAGGSAIAQLLPIVITPALTRLYSPADMGILALYLAFIGFATTVTTMGFSMAVVSARNDNEALDLVTISTLVSVPTSILCACLLTFLTSRNWLGFGHLHSLVPVAMAVSLLLTGLYTTMRYWLIRKGDYGTISGATVGQSFGRVATQVLAGLWRLGWPGLVGGEVIGRAAGLRHMYRGSWNDLRMSRDPLNFRRLYVTVSSYRKFPLFTAPSSLLNSLALSLPVPLISGTFGLDAGGQFSVASRVLLLPLALVGASIADVFHNRIASLSTDEPDLALPFFYKVAGALFIVGAIPMAVVALFGQTLWSVVLGQEWSLAGQVAAVITPWALAQLAVNPVSRVVAVYQGQEFKLVFDILALLSVVGVLSIASSLGWTLIHTCAVLGVTQSTAYGVYFVLLIRILKKYKYANYGNMQTLDGVN